MTAPKKAAPRKAAAPKAPPTAAEAADAEATNQSMSMTFRGLTFELEPDRMQSLHMLIARRAGDFASVIEIAFTPTQKLDILSLVKFGEDPVDAGLEIVNAIAEAAGWGNSEASG